jgi:uncharacterized DUF497 family protein
MAFEWDERKRETNLVKHGVDFIDVTSLFDGETIETVDDRKDYGEARLNCMGEIEGRLYVVTYVWRGAARRIISARRANARERKAYHARVK